MRGRGRADGMRRFLCSAAATALSIGIAVVTHGQTREQPRTGKGTTTDVANWQAFDFERLPTQDRACIAMSPQLWEVSVQEGAVRAVEVNVDLTAGRFDPLPFQLAPDMDIPKQRANRYVQRVQDGWLVGFDQGESGGALWWVDEANARRQKLANVNVRGFLPEKQNDRRHERELVLIGEGRSETGRVTMASRDAQGSWRLESVIDLGEIPMAFAWGGDAMLTVVTAEAVWRGRTPAELKIVAKPRFASLYPSSVVEDANGTIYVGRPFAIGRLTPLADSTYREDWLVPPGCRLERYLDEKYRVYRCRCGK